MYSIRREPNNSRYEIMNCIRQQQQLIFNNRQMIKTKQHFFWSTKFYDHTDRSRDILPVYRTPCTFQETRKDDASAIFCDSSLISFCVPDVYSPGSNGKCSPPPPSSYLPPPPSEWLS